MNEPTRMRIYPGSFVIFPTTRKPKKDRKMKLNYKTLIVGIVCVTALGLTGSARGDTKAELQAEMARLNADVDAFNARCAHEHTGDAALYQWCIAESARLEARKADLLARIKAASGQ